MVDKYDFELDMVGENSNSIILREVKQDSNVLEFGPAHGRMTKYLKEALNCKVSIVEKDLEPGNQAAQFAEYSLIGDNLGDIEKYYWVKPPGDLKYDHIIFADVLEHLYNPWEVLSKSKDLLADNGTILISIPNIAHNSVLIDLFNGKFEYREIGLLDNTHIRFFTNSSLLEMVDRAGLHVDKFMNARNVVENTEFNNSFSDVPDEVAEFLKERPLGDVYQFVWSLKK